MGLAGFPNSGVNLGGTWSPWWRQEELGFGSSIAEDSLKPTHTEKVTAQGVSTAFEADFCFSASGRNRKSRCARPGPARVCRLHCRGVGGGGRGREPLFSRAPNFGFFPNRGWLCNPLKVFRPSTRDASSYILSRKKLGGWAGIWTLDPASCFFSQSCLRSLKS